MSVLADVKADLAAWADAGELRANTAGLQAIALELAARLDGRPNEGGNGGLDDKAVAGVARELRATLEALRVEPTDDEDGFGADLSTPTRDTA